MSTNTLAFINPATGVQFGEVAMTAPENVQQIVEEVRAAFEDRPGAYHGPVGSMVCKDLSIRSKYRCHFFRRASVNGIRIGSSKLPN